MTQSTSCGATSAAINARAARRQPSKSVGPASLISRITFGRAEQLELVGCGSEGASELLAVECTARAVIRQYDERRNLFQRYPKPHEVISAHRTHAACGDDAVHGPDA